MPVAGTTKDENSFDDYEYNCERAGFIYHETGAFW